MLPFILLSQFRSLFIQVTDWCTKMLFSFLMMLTPSMLNIITWDGMATGNVIYAATHKHQLLAGKLEGHTESNTWTPNPLFPGPWEYSDMLRVTPGSVITGQKNGRQRCHRDAWWLHNFCTTVSDLSSSHVAYLLECEDWSTTVHLCCLLPQRNDCHHLVLLFESGSDESYSLYGTWLLLFPLPCPLAGSFPIGTRE